MSTHKRLSFDVTINAANEKINLEIADPGNISADNLALATWGSSEILANVLHKLDKPDLSGCGTLSRTHHVLELGAGTGLVGMSAATVWHTHAHLTDLTPILPNILANIALNQALITKHSGSACVGLLDWSDPTSPVYPFDPTRTQPFPADKARVILAADTIYSEEHPELLTGVLVAKLERSEKARYIMCYPLRVGYLDHIRDLWGRLQEAGLVCMKEGREVLGVEWEEDTPYEWTVWRWGERLLAGEGGSR
ncbi:hypothetical protein LTR62_000039 [Meristemomyces frigidus]|uniref:Uncharacterized protein n=1 Tax=Meristemomyces frigidus TaxID=1508187 RepID=A0AAN7TJ05_9PEZI|nr:hypothetical protein LTR62_000039 [Meristemomyces frigidus]